MSVGMGSLWCVTPIIRVTKGKWRIDFFTILKYEQFPEQTPDAHKWNSKYYKVLQCHHAVGVPHSPLKFECGTWFHLARRNGERELIDLAFSKKKADDHKEWLCRCAQARDQGGQDHASTRYIFTELVPITRTIFRPPNDSLLNYLKEENDDIEPKREMAGEGQEPIPPWWCSFKGTGEHKYDVTGIARKVNDTTVVRRRGKHQTIVGRRRARTHASLVAWLQA
ncbi:DNA topoisomerase [Lactarius sanguifluus]|nr:DNA topoisomerase [Lactarius sanguifluus]